MAATRMLAAPPISSKKRKRKEEWGGVLGGAALVVILVDNALRYTPSGGSVAVIVGKSSNDAALEVRDTGIGIPREAQDHVFERFYRADEARNRDSGGAGLGLAIAKQLVEDHDGRRLARVGTRRRLHLHRAAAAGQRHRRLQSLR